MTQLSLLDFTPASPPAATVGTGPGWYIVDLYSADAIRGPFPNPDDAAAELDDIDPEATRCRLAFRPQEEI